VLVDALDIPAPFDAHEMCRRLAVSRGRPIRLLPVALPPDGPCGVWLTVHGTDYVLYEQRTSRLHQEHIILHEVGHLVCQHEATPVLDEETAALLMPNLDRRMVERVLGRTCYSARDEQQAEMIASLVLQRADRPPAEPTWAVPAEVAGIVDRLESSLAHPHRRRTRG
jgi:hypothetical protein